MKENKYTPDEINETATYILQILRSNWPVIFSWGFSNPAAMVFQDMKALRFHVQGFLHKGNIVVALNEGADSFEVYKLDENYNVLPGELTGVYLDMLVDTIDQLVETEDPNSQEYADAVKNAVYTF